MIICFLNIKNSLELTDTKGHITFNEPINYWGLPGLAIWMMFVNDYMFFEYQKQPWVDWYKRSCCFQWNYPILRTPWPSYMNDVCKWLYAFWTSKTALSWLKQKVIFTFNEPIPYCGLHGLTMNDVCKWLYAFSILKTALSWLIQKVILLSMKLSHNEGSMA